jgi:hypothetical protein
MVRRCRPSPKCMLPLAGSGPFFQVHFMTSCGLGITRNTMHEATFSNLNRITTYATDLPPSGQTKRVTHLSYTTHQTMPPSSILSSTAMQPIRHKKYRESQFVLRRSQSVSVCLCLCLCPGDSNPTLLCDCFSSFFVRFLDRSVVWVSCCGAKIAKGGIILGASLALVSPLETTHVPSDDSATRPSPPTRVSCFRPRQRVPS